MAQVYQTMNKKTGKPHERYRYKYRDRHGKMRHGSGNKSRNDTLAYAQGLEVTERNIRLGFLPASAGAEKREPFARVMKAYLAWGNTHGGRGGRPWDDVHARNTKTRLEWWGEKLGLRRISDLSGSLSRVEKALQDFKEGHTGKTLQEYASALKAFCKWCVDRKYLDENPLTLLAKFDTTPETERRAMTEEEVHKLLEKGETHRRLCYEVALCTGLRADELRSLTVAHLQLEPPGLKLKCTWTKNRKSELLPIARHLAQRLAALSDGKGPGDRLLYVPSHTARDLDKDLEAAGIPKSTAEGKLDFHALRTSYVTFVGEAGAKPKEHQDLARHSDPRITFNIYAKARRPRLHQLADAVGETVLPPQACRINVERKAAGAEGDAASADGSRTSEQESWWRRRESNPHPTSQERRREGVMSNTRSHGGRCLHG